MTRDNAIKQALRGYDEAVWAYRVATSATNVSWVMQRRGISVHAAFTANLDMLREAERRAECALDHVRYVVHGAL